MNTVKLERLCCRLAEIQAWLKAARRARNTIADSILSLALIEMCIDGQVFHVALTPRQTRKMLTLGIEGLEQHRKFCAEGIEKITRRMQR